MKMLRATLLAATILTAGTASAQTTIGTEGPTEGFYVGAGAGWNNINPRPANIGPTRVEVKFKDGFAVSGSAGYKWANNLRTELELSYRENKVRNFNSSATPWTGKQRDTSLMTNVLYDLPTGGKLKPYIGAGVGFASVSWKQFKGAGPNGYDDTSTKFTWQGIAGVALDVGPRMQLTLDYRYKGSNGHNYSASNATAATQASRYDSRHSTVMLGFRYAFGSAPKAAPPAPPAPAAAPPAPPAEQKFLVFFDFDKSNLRNDSKNIVQQAADYAKKNGKVRLTTTGHTDTSGSDAYNQALSERRAKEVQKELNRLGIPNNEIVVLWKGESMPLVQTGDGVKEPQNRRVEIVLE